MVALAPAPKDGGMLPASTANRLALAPEMATETVPSTFPALERVKLCTSGCAPGIGFPLPSTTGQALNERAPGLATNAGWSLFVAGGPQWQAPQDNRASAWTRRERDTRAPPTPIRCSEVYPRPQCPKTTAHQPCATNTRSPGAWIPSRL